MKSGGNFVCRIFAVAGFFVASLFSFSVGATLTVTPITWNIIGLDSNSPATGPQDFPIGARVCTDVATSGVTSAFVWDTANTFINSRPSSLTSLTLGNIAAGACVDAYYEVEVTQNASAFDTTRNYHITASDSSGTYSTPTPRQLYVEHLISQNRNGVDSVFLNGTSVPAGGTMNLVVGNTYTITLNGHTATQGYEQFEAFINFPNVIFQVLSVSTTYSVGASSTRLYADTCTWDNDPNSPSYRACLASGKAGGTMNTVYTVKILSGAGQTQTLNTLLYDFSGSSFHYNSDFSAGGRIVNILDPTAATMSKAFSPSSTVVGGVSTLTITLGNSTTGLLTGYNFTDNFPAGMSVAASPNASTSGCGTPTFSPIATATSISFSNGSIAGGGTCTISVNVTTSGTGTYSNTTNHLFVGTTDTTKFATAALNVTTTPPPPACTNGLELARWIMAPTQPNPTTVPPLFFYKSTSVSNAAASYSGTGTSAINTTIGNPINSWGVTSGWAATNAGYPNGGAAPYFEFLLDTSKFTGVSITYEYKIEGNWAAAANNHLYVYSNANGGSFTNLRDISGFTKNDPWASNSVAAAATGSSTTAFRINAVGQQQNTAQLLLDNIAFTGCGVPDKPTIAKTFSPNPVALNGTSTLTFTLTNTNNVPLTGVTFTDNLPPGLEVASTPAASTTCGGSPTWAPTAGATALTFGSPTGATIPARAASASSGSCTVSVSVKATTAGPHNNVSGYISAAETGGIADPNTGAGGSATATLTAVLPPAIAKNFSPDPIIQNGVSKLTFTITNPNLSDAISGVAFSDTFPTSPGQMRVAATPNAATSGCGTPTFAPVAAATSITFSAGSIAAGGTCTVSVDVTAPTTGTYSNTTGNVSHVINAATVNSNAATDTLTVTPVHPAMQLLKQIGTTATGPWSSFTAVAAGANVFYQFTVENAGDVAINVAIGFLTDPALASQITSCAWKNGSGTTVTLPAVLPVAVVANNNHLITCVVGPVAAISGTHTNTATATATLGGVACGLPCTDMSSATYQTGAITLTKRAVQSSYAAAGDIIDYEYTVTNVGPALAGPIVTVSDNKATVTCESISSKYGTTYLAAGQFVTCEAAYTVTAADASAASVVNIATAFAGGLTSNQVTLTVPKNASVTRAVVSRMSAYVDGGQSWLEWETTSEIGTAGFNVYRRNGSDGWVKLNDRLLPALIGQVQGGVYRVADPGFAVGAHVTYGLEEVEATGGRRKLVAATLALGASRPAPRGAVTRGSAGVTSGVAGYGQTAHAPNGRTGKAHGPAAANPSATNSALRILVEQDGLYTVTADQIAAALGVNPNQAKQWIAKTQLRLQQKGQQVAWLADAANDRLYFYGQALQGVDSVYTRYNVYWLDRGAGQPMSVVGGAAPAPASILQPFVSHIHAEQNVLAMPFVTNDPDADFWYWGYTISSSPGLGAPASFMVAAPNAVGAGTATLSAFLQGSTDMYPGNDHHAHVSVNGTPVGAISWDGIAPQTLSASFPADLLAADGNNTISVAGELDPGIDYSVFLVNGFDLDYPRTYQAVGDELRLRGAGNPVVTVGGFSGTAIRVLDITDPRRPKVLTGTTISAADAGKAISFAPATLATDYLAAIARPPVAVEGDTPSTTLKRPTNAASYVVLTPGDLRAGADALAAYRGGRVVELKAIYDEFNFGIANPYAVRDFIAYAAQNWSTKPRQVALVGKGTFDHKDYLGYGTDLFPVLMGATPDGLSAADNRLADFNNDGIPDVAIGRIPAITSADVTNYVAKLASYDANGRRPANQALLLADYPDDGGPFTTNNLLVAQALQVRGYETTSIELETTPPDVAQAQLLSGLNSPAGVGLFNFVGHGGTNQITNLITEEALLRNDPGIENVSQLANGAKLPVFLGFTCAVGDGSYPGFDSLAESLLWRQGGGAVASFVPTALTLNGQSHMLNLSLIDSLVGSNARASLGEAATAALEDFATKGGLRFMLETYSVVGDPALRVQQ